MLQFLKKKKALRVLTMATMMVFCFGLTAFAADTAGASVTSTLSVFSELAAWIWKEIGLFVAFVFAQPILVIAISVPFVGLIVNFFLRIFKTA